MMTILGTLLALACIIGVIAPIGMVFFRKQTERSMHEEMMTLLFLLFLGLPLLGAIINFLFGNDLAIGIVVILGLIGINILVFKDKL